MRIAGGTAAEDMVDSGSLYIACRAQSRRGKVTRGGWKKKKTRGAQEKKNIRMSGNGKEKEKRKKAFPSPDSTQTFPVDD